MIKYLPKIYPNESFYSYLSRLFCHSGFITSVGFSKEVLARDKAKVNYEFINELNPSFKELLLSHISYEELLLNHTLFKYHIRFLDNDKKKEAYDYAMTNKSLLFHKLPVPLNKNYYLRYCPLCVKEDRLNYGESYYHVEHMFPYINVCPNHNCKLIDTKLRITSEYNRAFVPSEELIDKFDVEIYDKTNINVIVSKYIYNLFKEPMKYDVEGSVGKYLTSKLNDKYLSIRYKRKNLDSLYDDFKEYYKELNGFNISKNRLSRIYSGTCKNMNLIKTSTVHLNMQQFFGMQFLVRCETRDEILMLPS